MIYLYFVSIYLGGYRRLEKKDQEMDCQRQFPVVGEGGGSSYPRKILKFKILRNGISIILRPNQHVTNLISFFIEEVLLNPRMYPTMELQLYWFNVEGTTAFCVHVVW